MNLKEKKYIKWKLDNDLLFFTRYFYLENQKRKFIVNWHHKEITNKLEDVENYKIIVLNINIPPRMSKTELAINFIARSLGKNPSANFLYITASDELRGQTSVEIRNLIESTAYKQFYDIELRKDQNAKNLWRTKQGGGLKTATIFGQITGFGAGQMIEHNEDLENYLRNFEGCIIMDDINKMDDAENLTANNSRANRIIGNTVLSRKNSKDTPIINIQQRAGLDDATAYLNQHFQGNEKLVNLVLPVINENNEPLWPWKMGLKEIEEIKRSPKTKATFQTQYMQDPHPDEDSLFFIKDIHYKIIDNDAIPKEAKLIPYGSDLGFNPDPSTLYELYKKDNYIYIDELLYKQNLINVDPSGNKENINTLDYYLRKLTKKSSIVVMDIDHVAIRELRLCNHTIMPALKGPGSIESGLRKMHGYTLMITKRSVNLLNELKGYIKIKDPLTGFFIFKPDPKIRLKHGIDSIRYVIFSESTYW